MSNEEYLLTLYNSYNNARYFSLKNGNFILNMYNAENKKPEIPLNNLILSAINPCIFLLHPAETFQIIHMLELLYKRNLSDNEKNFIISYTYKYMELPEESLTDGSDINRNYSLSIPIYTSYDPLFIEMPASLIIQELLIKNSKENENSNGKQQSLTLKNNSIKNSNIIPIDSEDRFDFAEYRSAGFATLVLIGATVILTVLYITTYIIQK